MNRIILILTFLCVNSFAFAQENVFVKLKVDASSLKGIKGFGVRGSARPLSWEKTIPLEDDDKDGIYEGYLSFPSTIEMVEYKYLYGDKKTNLGVG
ncbi:MAG: hypothetical protein HC892_22930 [Saprospiraceae bacterium]|nr:hypothetical protein [Saprospiraceae bacterium]